MEYGLKVYKIIGGIRIWYYEEVDFDTFCKYQPDPAILDEIEYNTEGGRLGSRNNPYLSEKDLPKEI